MSDNSYKRRLVDSITCHPIDPHNAEVFIIA